MYGIYGTPITYARSGGKRQQAVELPGSLLRGLAAGENLCPGRVTVAKTPGKVPCQANEREPVPESATIEFADCELSGGGRLDGMVHVDTRLTASDTECDADTRIDVSFTSAATNLSYTAASGVRV